MGGVFKIKGSSDFKESAPGLTFLSISGSLFGALGNILGVGSKFFEQKGRSKTVAEIGWILGSTRVPKKELT